MSRMGVNQKFHKVCLHFGKQCRLTRLVQSKIEAIDEAKRHTFAWMPPVPMPVGIKEPYRDDP